MSKVCTEMKLSDSDDWESDIVKLQSEMSIAALIKEKQRLDEYFEDSANDDDDDASERWDNVQHAIDKTIYKDNRLIIVTKWGRPILDRVGLERLVEGLSDDDKTLVRDLVEGRHRLLCSIYRWNLDNTLVPRRPLSCKG